MFTARKSVPPSMRHSPRGSKTCNALRACNRSRASIASRHPKALVHTVYTRTRHRAWATCVVRKHVLALLCTFPRYPHPPGCHSHHAGSQRDATSHPRKGDRGGRQAWRIHNFPFTYTHIQCSCHCSSKSKPLQPRSCAQFLLTSFARAASNSSSLAAT